jgi:lipopolysaccharide export system permease protein
MRIPFKRLYIFSVRSFAGPFVVTFLISMFILIMQFFWLYIDDLMGKGIEIAIILELLLYVSASLIPLALPLAILLSSIVTFGNLSEHNELTALKSSGLSLLRIMRPLIIVVLLISAGTFYFANYIIPVANLKWHSIIYDIQNTKISTILTPGAYATELDGYAIKVDEVKDDYFTNIIIHDHTSENEVKTIRAKDGRMFKSEYGKYVYFQLNNGTIVEELASQAPLFNDEGTLIKSKNSNRPSRRSSFKNSTYKIDLSGFDISRSEEELFKNDFEMLNVFQLKYAIDSLQKKADDVTQTFIKNAKMDAIVFQSDKLKGFDTLKNALSSKDALPSRVIRWESLSNIDKIASIDHAQTSLRRRIDNLGGQQNFMGTIDESVRNYKIESNRKFALTYTIIVLFFVGAPLGAIVRKGGFGAPVVIAALLFMIYFVLFSIGENMAKSDMVSPFIGMWFAAIVLTPIAVLLMRAAINDSPIFVKDNWIKYFNKFKKKKSNESSATRF